MRSSSPQLLLATATLLAASGQPPVRREPFRAGAVKRWATVSDCGRYRYTLGRRWAEGSLLLWLLLNPSTADHRRDDATARVVEGFSRRLGFGGYQIRRAGLLDASPFAFRLNVPARRADLLTRTWIDRPIAELQREYARSGE